MTIESAGKEAGEQKKGEHPMAKAGNKSQGPKHVIVGQCVDCGTRDGAMVAVRRFRGSGKGRMVKLCAKCAPKA